MILGITEHRLQPDLGLLQQELLCRGQGNHRKRVDFGLGGLDSTPGRRALIHEFLKTELHRGRPLGHKARLKQESKRLDSACLWIAIIDLEKGLPDPRVVVKEESHIILAHDFGVLSLRRATHLDLSILQDIDYNKRNARTRRSLHKIRLGKEQGKMALLLHRIGALQPSRLRLRSLESHLGLLGALKNQGIFRVQIHVQLIRSPTLQHILARLRAITRILHLEQKVSVVQVHKHTRCHLVQNLLLHLSRRVCHKERGHRR